MFLDHTSIDVQPNFAIFKKIGKSIKGGRGGGVREGKGRGKEGDREGREEPGGVGMGKTNAIPFLFVESELVENLPIV